MTLSHELLQPAYILRVTVTDAHWRSSAVYRRTRWIGLWISTEFGNAELDGNLPTSFAIAGRNRSYSFSDTTGKFRGRLISRLQWFLFNGQPPYSVLLRTYSLFRSHRHSSSSPRTAPTRSRVPVKSGDNHAWICQNARRGISSSHGRSASASHNWPFPFWQAQRV